MKRWTCCGMLAVLFGLQCSAAQADLVLHYTFDETAEFTDDASDTISDVSGNGRNAVEGPRNILWSTGGISGGAIDARTNDSYFGPTSDLPAGLVPANEYTLSFWVKSNDTTNFEDWGQVTYSDGQTAQLRTLDPTRGFYYRDTAPNPDWNTTNRGTNLKDDQWHHVALVFDPSDDTLTTYLDAATPRTITGNPRTNGEYLQSFLIGRSSIAAGPTGLIDDVQLYNAALTENQVTFLYNNPGQAVPVPEPTAGVLTLIGLGLLVARRRR